MAGGGIDVPDGAEFPISFFAQRLKNAQGGFLQRSRFGQHPADGVLHLKALLGALAFAHDQRQHHCRQRDGAHERLQQQQGLVWVRSDKGAPGVQRAPQGHARNKECRGHGPAFTKPERGPR